MVKNKIEQSLKTGKSAFGEKLLDTAKQNVFVSPIQKAEKDTAQY